MTNINQILVAGSTTPIQVSIKTNNKSDRHWHRNIELDYVLSGHMEIQVKDQTYYIEKDQLILINSYDIHCIRNDDCILAILEIDPSKYDHKLVKEASLRFDCNCATRQEQELFTPLKALLARFIQSNSVEDEYNEIINKSLSYAILHYLMKMFLTEPITDYVTQRSQISRMEGILKYINLHYMENLTLRDLAAKFYLTVPYMSKIFKDYIGTNYTEYMSSIRLSHALSEIGDHSITIDMLAEKSGFSNTRSFVSAFKEAYGELPSQYRKNLLQKMIPVTNNLYGDTEIDTLHHHHLEILSKYLESPEQAATPQPVHVIEIAPVSVSQKGFPLKHNFKNTTSIGRAKDILFAENQVMLRELQKDIGFKFIKFHGILDDDMMVYSELSDGTPQITFTYIDMVIDFLLSIHLRPLVELSFMPRALAKDFTHMQFYNKSIISLPCNINKWIYLIKEFILHLESRYSTEEVEKWIFCLWNEPDSPSDMFGIGTCKEYFDFYHATHLTVKSCNPNLIFGAPSVLPSTIQSGVWINEFLTLCREQDCTPAFLNFHFYPIAGSPESLPTDIQTYPHMLYMKSPDALRECIYSLKANAKQYHWDIETVYLTEWNSSISYRELLNDTSYKAPYVVKNILDNYDHIESFGYWVLSDFIEEVKVSGELFHGGLGLFTYNGIKKAPYYAIVLLRKLGNHLIGRGDGYFITKEKECFQIILYNYQHFSDLYASGELFDMTFNNRYTPFPNAKRKKYVIPLADVTNSEYILTETIINRAHGSAFDKWAELGALPLETQDDINYLKSISVPLIKKRKLSVENNYLTVSCELEPHEVRLIEIRAQYR